MPEQMTEAKPSVRLTEASLDAVGVDLVNPHNVVLLCQNCGQVWSPNIQRGGHLPRGWWKCPNGCNAEM